MAHIYDIISEHFGKERIVQTAQLLEENESNVFTGIQSVVSGLLGVFVKKGRHLQMTEILEEAGKLNILSDVKTICNENPTYDQQRIGDDFLQQLLGDRAVDFSAPIATRSGLSQVAVNRLVSMVAPVVAGVLGGQMVKNRWNITRTIDEVENQRNFFSNLIPAGVVKAFDLGALLQHKAEAKAETVAPAATKPAPVPVAPPKKKNAWINWLIIILLLLLLFLLWRSCGRKHETIVEREVLTIREAPVKPVVENPALSETVSTELTLPNGVKLQAYKGGVEDRMITFLQSDEYKNATNDQLKNKWFEFDNIDFVFDSSTELMDHSKVQLSNIAAILKYFKDVKLVIAGKADKVGSDNVNMSISQKRAKTIETLLEKEGVTNLVKIEGLGEKYAKHASTESDQARAEDRDIALRFTK